MEERKSTKDLIDELRKLAIEGDSTALKGIAALASKNNSAMECLIDIARKGSKEAVSYLLTLTNEGYKEAYNGLKEIIIETDRRILIEQKKLLSIEEEEKGFIVDSLTKLTYHAVVELNMLDGYEISEEEREEITNKLTQIQNRNSIMDQICNVIRLAINNNVNTYLIDLAIHGDTEAMKLLSDLAVNEEAPYTASNFYSSIESNPEAYDCLESIVRMGDENTHKVLFRNYVRGSEKARYSIHKLAEENLIDVVVDMYIAGATNSSEFERFIELVKKGLSSAIILAEAAVNNNHCRYGYDAEKIEYVKEVLLEAKNKSDVELLAMLNDTGKGAK